MLDFSDLALGAIVVGIAAFFWTHIRVREKAEFFAKQACDQKQAQLLDGTVGLKKLKLVRGASGSLVWQRQFEFEFSLSGNERLQGVVFMRGDMREYVHMDMPGNSEITIH